MTVTMNVFNLILSCVCNKDYNSQHFVKFDYTVCVLHHQIHHHFFYITSVWEK